MSIVSSLSVKYHGLRYHGMDGLSAFVIAILTEFTQGNVFDNMGYVHILHMDIEVYAASDKNQGGKLLK